MNTSKETVCAKIRAALSVQFPTFPVSIVESPDDNQVLCVRVFCVPSEETRAVKATINQIEQEVCPEGDFLLLPMVKNPEVTKQYYPQFMPSIQSSFVEVFAKQFLSPQKEQDSVWHSVSSESESLAAFGTSSIQPGFNFDFISSNELPPSRKLENFDLANSELALAA